MALEIPATVSTKTLQDELLDGSVVADLVHPGQRSYSCPRLSVLDESELFLPD